MSTIYCSKQTLRFILVVPNYTFTFHSTRESKLKYVPKICGINFEIVTITRPCIRFFSFRQHLKALWLSRAWFLGFVIRICLNVKSQWTKKIEVFYQGTDDSKNLRCETLYIGDYEYVNILNFAVLSIKPWLEEVDDLNRNDPLHSFKFIQSKAQNWYEMLLSFSYNYRSKTANLKIQIGRNNDISAVLRSVHTIRFEGSHSWFRKLEVGVRMVRFQGSVFVVRMSEGHL